MNSEAHCAVGSTIVLTQFWMWRLPLSILLIARNHQPANALWQLLFLPTILAGSENLIPNEYWLPGEVVPVHYDFKLVVHMDNLTTRGEVKVDVEVVKATSRITLHANSSFLKIDHEQVAVHALETELLGPGSNEISVEGHKEDGEKEFYTLELNWL